MSIEVCPRKIDSGGMTIRKVDHLTRKTEAEASNLISLPAATLEIPG